MKIKDLNEIYESVTKEREIFEPDFRQLAKHFFSRKLRFIDTDYGQTKECNLRLDLLDPTGVQAARVLSSGMHGGLTSPARPWFELGLEDTDLMKFKPAKEWLNTTQYLMRNMFRRSNFYKEIYSVYRDLGVFGPNFMFEHYYPGVGLSFNSLPMGSYAMSFNFHNQVNIVCRTLELKASDIVEEFGEENCSEKVISAHKKASNNRNPFYVRHLVMPNKNAKSYGSLNTNMKFISCYWEMDSREKLLRKSGYNDFPGFGSRWFAEGNGAYGGSPGQDILGAVQSLQSMRATQFKQEHKKADPPMVLPEGLEYYDGMPSGETFLNTSMEGQKQVYPAEGSRPDTGGLPYLISDLQIMVRQGMYNDLFIMLMNAPYTAKMTATEIAERHEEKLIQLGPVLEGLHSELFNPLIDRTFNLMAFHDLLPPAPDELRGKDIKVEFVSILAQAQKMVDTNKIDQFMGFIGRNAGLLPELLDVPDPDKMADRYADYLSVPEDILRSLDERRGRRDQRAADQQAQQNAAMGESAAGISKTLSDTPIQGGDISALDSMLSGIGGA